MKYGLILALSIISLNLLAAEMVYEGNNNGASCTLSFDFIANSASLGDCQFKGNKKIFRNEKYIIFEGEAENFDCKVEIELSEYDYPHILPIKASLFKKSILKPLYTRELKCTDLKRVK